MTTNAPTSQKPEAPKPEVLKEAPSVDAPKGQKLLMPGEVVHYTLDGAHNETRLALVLRETAIGSGANLRVFFDGLNDTAAKHYAPEGHAWLPSVPYSAEPKPHTWRMKEVK